MSGILISGSMAICNNAHIISFIMLPINSTSNSQVNEVNPIHESANINFHHVPVNPRRFHKRRVPLNRAFRRNDMLNRKIAKSFFWNNEVDFGRFILPNLLGEAGSQILKVVSISCLSPWKYDRSLHDQQSRLILEKLCFKGILKQLPLISLI